jgi:hypothetical protein
MWEETTSRVIVTDRLYGEFYGFYSIGTEYFGQTLVQSIKTSNLTAATDCTHSFCIVINSIIC